MSAYYPTGCDELVPAHVCDPCEEAEKGRISSIAFVKDTFAFTNITSPVEWRAGFLSGDIILIPEVIGSYDGGAEQEGPGYGRQLTKLTGYNFSLTYKDPNYKNNCDFYNSLKRARNYKVAFVTSSQVHLSDDVVQVIPKNPVTDDLNSDVVWEVLVKWNSVDLPCPNNVPANIFELCTMLT